MSCPSRAERLQFPPFYAKIGCLLNKANAMVEERTRLTPYVEGSIYLVDYPIRFAGCTFNARMSVVRLQDGSLWLHSPCDIDAALKAEIEAIGPVRYLVGPGNYHWLHLRKASELFPEAQVFICPGIERKEPLLKFDGLLGDHAPEPWAAEIEQVLVRGTRFIWEVAFFHKASKTLIITDLLENIGDATPGVNFLLKFWWKVVFGMWNKVRPAPEYQMGWKHREAVRTSLESILAWDFVRVILAHGDLIEENARDVVRAAWHKQLMA